MIEDALGNVLGNGRPVSVFVGIPSHDYLPAFFAYDLARLAAFSATALGEISINLVAGTYIHNARQAIADRAILENATHLLWLDSDMRFPPDALVRLLAHGRPMVGINYSTRAVPGRFVAMKRFALGSDEAPEWLATGPESTGLEDVEAMGFGMVLMWTDVLHSVRQADTLPIFAYEWVPERREWFGEDFYFCRKAGAAGIPMYVDHDLSKECSHIGSAEYRLDRASALEPVGVTV